MYRHVLNLCLTLGATALGLVPIWLAWYAYYRWRKNPQTSISQYIARWGIANPWAQGVIVGAVGMGVVAVLMLVLGMLLGHWFWPVVVRV